MAAVIYEMQGVTIMRVVQTKEGSGIITAYDRINGLVEVRTCYRVIICQYEEIEITCLIFKKWR